MTAILIGLDVGTSSIKGAAISSGGGILCQEKEAAELLFSGDGRVEFRIEVHFEKVLKVVRGLVERLPKGSSVAGIALSGAAGSTVLLDKEGNPLMDAICWMDERARNDRVESIERLDPSEVHKISGWPFSNIFPLANLAWIKEKLPDVYRRKARFCTDVDYACHGLSGNWTLDFSCATPTYLMDQRSMRWHRPYLEMLELPEESLSKLVPPGTVIGKITDDAMRITGLGHGTSLVAGSFDHPSAAIGTGVLGPDSLLISTGTSWVGFFPADDRAKAIRRGLLVDPFMSQKGGCWGAIFSIPKIGGTVDSLLNRIFAGVSLSMAEKYEKMAGLAAREPAGAGGLFIDLTSQPENLPAYSAGLLCRSIMESAAYMLRSIVEENSSRAETFSRIVMCGGPSQNRVWTQIVADVTGIPLLVAGGESSGAIGAAILAGIGTGIFKDEREGFKALKLAPRTVEPDLNIKKVYDENYGKLVEDKALGQR